MQLEANKVQLDDFIEHHREHADSSDLIRKFGREGFEAAVQDLRYLTEWDALRETAVFGIPWDPSLLWYISWPFKENYLNDQPSEFRFFIDAFRSKPCPSVNND